jgi:4-hydroxy-3-polyprenylbenzoate decarboxylase
MVICPCSMGTVAAIAGGTSRSLVERAADVTLKERRRLVVVARETPLHLGHLRLMTQVTELGGLIMPPMPAFYHRPQSLAEIVDQTVNRVLDQFGIVLPEDLFKRWSGPAA